ncbi:MAG TPA: SIS domain-containing protein [Candidatus Limnocylindria bacterium]|jgi:D-sedoheptulose 7-phosphate isomerase|nr:SIS domain-containing protein [Candidatus Limnocylindria bacterium]
MAADSGLLAAQLEGLLEVLGRSRALLPDISRAGDEIRRALQAGGKLLTAGNGGSAADALHLAEELVGRFDKERPALAAISLCGDPTLLTCIGNDYGYERLFSRQVEGLGRPGDVLVIFSTSGNSPNLVAALHSARAGGLKTIAVLGKTGGKARGLADHEIVVPSDVTARVQEVHTFILHCWLALIEADLG